EGGKALRGHGSIHWTLERERRGGPVFLEFWLGTMQVGEIRHEDGQGWARFEVPLQESPGGIEVRVRTPVAAERHFCWEGVIRK
ncbi:MAG: hypothetical protein NZX77_13010, partial [Polyangiaceae bacterium]|nr:hypothetical protein [Polyangiaceae bacterium]